MRRKDLHHVKTHTHTQSDPQLQGKDTTVLEGSFLSFPGQLLACRNWEGMTTAQKGGVVINTYPKKSACGDGSSPRSFLPNPEQHFPTAPRARQPFATLIQSLSFVLLLQEGTIFQFY